MDFKRTACFPLLFACLLVAAPPAAGQVAPGFMDIDEVKPGMRGYGLSVFQDARIDTFEVEVLGVMKNIFYTEHDLIMVGVSGPYVDEAGVIAGMSGSPVYIGGKLVGALAYRFGQFPMKPIAGVTPIGHMLAIRELAEADTLPAESTPGDRFKGLGDSQDGAWAKDAISDPVYPMAGDHRSSTVFSSLGNMPAGPSSFQPIAVPMVFSGFNPMTVRLFEEELRRRGLIPVSGGGVSRDVSGRRAPGTAFGMVSRGNDAIGYAAQDQAVSSVHAKQSVLEPGSAVSAQLIRGDFNLSGTGTVTWRDEDAILAFGHPFLWTGALSIPMNRAEIITVIPDQSGSTKISSVSDEVGSVLWDHTNGIYGQLGGTARMIPVELSYDDQANSDQRYRFDVMMANGWTPMLVNMTVVNTILAHGRAAGERTISLGGRIVLREHPDIVIDDLFSGRESPALLARDVRGVLNGLLDNRFITPVLESVKIEVGSSDERRTAVIEDVWFGSETLKPGDTLEVRIFLRPYRGPRLVKRIDVPIPKNLSNGLVQVLVGSAQAIIRHDLNAVPQRYRPADGPSLIELLNGRRTGNRVYLKMFQAGAGGIVKGREMPGLPPSVLATMHSERTKGSFIPIREKVVAEQAIRTEYVVTGQNWSRLTVKR